MENTDLHPLLWRSEILGYTFLQGGKGSCKKSKGPRAHKAHLVLFLTELRVERSRMINELTGDGNVTKEQSMLIKCQTWKSAYRW